MIDVGYHKIAIAEARKLGIPLIAVVDTNHSPEGIDYLIPVSYTHLDVYKRQAPGRASNRADEAGGHSLSHWDRGGA